MTTQQIYAKGDTKPFIDLLLLFLSSKVLVWLCVCMCVCVLVTDRIQQLGVQPSLVVIVIASSLSALLLSHTHAK